MLKREAEWLGRQLATMPDDELFPLLNLGSSTLTFRTRQQPHIDEFVFAPLRARGGEVIHADIKQAEGVDLVGDLGDPAFRERLTGMGLRSVMVSNLLEHLVEPRSLTEDVTKLFPEGGRIIVTGPYDYPRHLDPIDNLLRPTPEEAAELFPGSELETGEIIDAGGWFDWQLSSNLWGARILGRAALPVPGSERWHRAAAYLPYLRRHAKAFGAILRMPPQPPGDAASGQG